MRIIHWNNNLFKSTFLACFLLLRINLIQAQSGCTKVLDGVSQTFTNCWEVNNSDGTSATVGSFQWALSQAKASLGNDYIGFSIAGNINITSWDDNALTNLDGIYIDGASAVGYSTNLNPVIVIQDQTFTDREYIFQNVNNFTLKGIFFKRSGILNFTQPASNIVFNSNVVISIYTGLLKKYETSNVINNTNNISNVSFINNFINIDRIGNLYEPTNYITGISIGSTTPLVCNNYNIIGNTFCRQGTPSERSAIEVVVSTGQKISVLNNIFKSCWRTYSNISGNNINFSDTPIFNQISTGSLSGKTSKPFFKVELFTCSNDNKNIYEFLGSQVSDINGNWSISSPKIVAGANLTANATPTSSSSVSDQNLNSSLFTSSLIFPSITSSIPNLICTNSSSFDIDVTPSGGTLSGPGVSGNTFTPSNSGIAGIKLINYDYYNIQQQATSIRFSFPISTIESIFIYPTITPITTNFTTFTSTASLLQWSLNSYLNPVSSNVSIEAYPAIQDASGLKLPNWNSPFSYLLGAFTPSSQVQTSSIANLGITTSLNDVDYFWRVKFQEVASGKTYYSDFQRFTLKGTQTTSSPTFPTAISSTDVINYNYEVSYLDGGKTSESIVYTDGLGNTRQVQTKLNTESKIMAVETAYSEEGGGTVQSLPAPTEQTQFAYAKNFFDINDAGTLRDFTTEHFDKETSTGVLIDPTPLATTAKAAAYYSSSNSDPYVDDAQGYPYSYKVWMKNPLGKAQLNAGAGNTFRYKQDGSGKNTTYAYSAVASEDLQRIFGKAEAATMKNVSAITSIDPNGISNFTYQDKDGKVLATAINACSVTTMDKPDGVDDNDFPVTYNVLENDKIEMGTLEKTTSKSFNISCADTDVDFNYTFDAKTMPTEGTVSCIFCQYDIDLKIIENATGLPVYTYSFSVPSDDAAPTNCSSSIPQYPTSAAQNPTTTVRIQRPGSYTAIRTIKPKFDQTTGKTVIEKEFERFTADVKTSAAYNLANYNATVAPDVKEEWFLLRKKKSFRGLPTTQSEWYEYQGCITNPSGANCSKWLKTDWYVDNFVLSNQDDINQGNGIIQYTNSSNKPYLVNELNFLNPNTSDQSIQPSFWFFYTNPKFFNDYSMGTSYSSNFITNLVIPSDGVYNLYIYSDDGTTLYLDDNLIINNSSAYSGIWNLYNIGGKYEWKYDGPIQPANIFNGYLTKGNHPIRLYFNGSGVMDYLMLFWKKPGDSTYSLIPSDNYFANSTNKYKISGLDGKIQRSGDEAYLVSNLINQTSIQPNNLIYTNFIQAFNSQNFKNITSQNIIEFSRYDIQNGFLYDLKEGNPTTELKYLQDDMTLATRLPSEPNEYYFIKVKYNTGGCEQQAYVKKGPPVSTSNCASDCAEQEAALIQDRDLKFADITNFSTSISYSLPDPICPTANCTNNSNYTLVQLRDMYNATNAVAFKRNWATTFDLMKTQEVNQTGTKGSILLEKWIAATDRLTLFVNASTCVDKCNNASICDVVSPVFKSCVLDNISEIGRGFDYLRNKSLIPGGTIFANGGGFPFAIDNTKSNRIDKIIITPYDRKQLGEPLFNFIMKYFDSPVNQITSWDFWMPSTQISSSVPIGYSYGICSETQNYDLSNFSPGLVKVLEDANLTCQNDFKNTLEYQTNGDSYLISQYVASCIETGTDPITCTSSITPQYIRTNIIKKTLLEVYPNPADYSAKYTLLQQKDGGAYWLWLMGANNTAYTPNQLTKISDLIQFMMNYGDTEKIMASCENRNRKAYEEWKKGIIQKYKETLTSSYLNSCFGQMNEVFTIKYNSRLYQYTLYKYDGAGRLIQTVPPQGVDLVDVRASSPDSNKTPAHKMVSTYGYDSFGQLVTNTTPDGGTTKFAYDNLGRVRFSESAEQRVRGVCSFINYDQSGRIVKTGELDEDYPRAVLQIENQTYPDNREFFNDKIDYYYNTPKAGIPTNLNFTQTYLEGRLSYTENDNVATHYSYDVQGRVNAILHEYKALSGAERYKKINYQYQVVSGIIEKVIYQQGVVGEEFSHRYSYDNDIRLIKVEVSKNGINWSQVAIYAYYTHGPLKSLSLGDVNNQLQCINYTYNLQGWLKAINHPNPEFDPSQDGLVGSASLFAKDVFGMILNYYSGDYVRTGVIPGTSKSLSLSSSETSLFQPITPTDGSNSVNRGASLYNGNISAILSYTAFDQSRTMGSVDPILSQRFRYDYLNRLKGSYAETRANLNLPAPSTAIPWAANTSGISKYQELMSYDFNGNIKTLQRSGATPSYFDDLNFFYNTAGTDNKLLYVDDSKGGLGGNDMADQNAGNYAYDEKGRLIKDVSESINPASGNGISWTSLDKIKSITRLVTGKSNLNFTYDPMGRRASKKVMDPNNPSTELFTEYYVYDATGNTIATYKKPSGQALNLQECYVYGSSRLGSYEGTTSAIEPAKLNFEITDHLGNVRAVIGGDNIIDGTVNSNYLAFDSYSSTTQNLAGSTGGAGWSTNAWTQSGSPPPIGYTIATSSTDKFTYNNITSSLGRAEATGGFGIIGRAINVPSFNVTHSVTNAVTGEVRTWNHNLTDGNGMITNANRSTWLSFLIRKNNTVIADEASISLTSDATPGSRENVALAVGYFGQQSATGPIQYWSLKIGNTVYKSNVQVGPISGGVGAACFVVVEIAPGRVDVYFNPSVDAIGNRLNSPPSLSITPTSTLTYKNVVYYGGGIRHSAVDEIKIGQSLPNVINFSNSDSKYEKLLLHEPFDLPNGTPLVGTIGAGSGTNSNWSGPWAVPSSVFPVMSGTSLPYSDMQAVSGGNVSTNGYARPVGRVVDLTGTSPFAPLINAGLVGKNGTTLWTGVLLQINSDGLEENSLSLGNETVPFASGPNAVSVGYFGLASHDAAGNRYWSVKVGSNIYLSNKPIVKNVPALLVTKIEFITNASKVSFYVNPNLFSELPPTVPDYACPPTSLNLAFKNVVYQGNNGSMDELVFGQNFSAVGGVRGKRARILALTDYYPFGLEMPGRKFVGDGYKYGFNGKEKDAETDNYDYGFRMYRPNIGKFLSVDPLAKSYPWNSTYAFAENDVVRSFDLDGLEKVIYDFNFTEEAISVTKIELENAGPFGDGVLVRSNHQNSLHYYYGKEIKNGNIAKFKKYYEGTQLDKEGNHVTYYDTKENATIGYGHKIEKGEPYDANSKLTEEEALKLFDEDVKRIKKALNKRYDLTQLKQNEIESLVDASFNLGPNKIKYNNEAGRTARQFVFMKYLKDGEAINKRRFAESLLFSENKYFQLDVVKKNKSTNKKIQTVDKIIDKPKFNPKE